MITLERQSIPDSEISAAKSRLGILNVFGRITHEYGFRYFMLLKDTADDEIYLDRIILETNLPRAYVSEFDRRRLLRRCLALREDLETALPLCWALQDPVPLPGRDLPPELIELQREYDVTATVVMGMHSLDGSGFYICLDGSRPRLTQVELNEIGMILLHAFTVFDKIRRAETRAAAQLTARELEVVRWTSEGKTSVEIGKILSLSDHTINAYMNSAMRRLDCVNRTQLVAKALRLKIIT